MASLECGAFPPLLFFLLNDPKQKRRENAALQNSAASATLILGYAPSVTLGAFIAVSVCVPQNQGLRQHW
jgi:hypothetical protein